MSTEVQLIEDYFKAFNAHDIEAVVNCFTDDAIITSGDGSRSEGAAGVREAFEWYFATFPDARCELKRACGSEGTGAVESVFTGTHRGTERTVRMVGAEVLTIRDGKINELSEYHFNAPVQRDQPND
jgi:steroid delta-isomerase-like uncharacterized protein